MLTASSPYCDEDKWNLEIMLGQDAPIRMYWWKGDLGRRRAIQNLVYRLRQGYPIVIRNFGDLIGPYIVERLSGRPVRYSKGSNKLVTVGSIFVNVRSKDVVWGTGMLRPSQIPPSDITISLVRGPRTRKALVDAGIDCPQRFGDPAVLLPLLYRPTAVLPRMEVGVVPHFEDYRALKRELDDPSIRLIDPLAPLERVVDSIVSCDVVLSSSLHGLIVAEAYGKKAAYVQVSEASGGGLFKYQDYYESTGRDVEVVSWAGGADVRRAVASAERVPEPRFNREQMLRSFPYLRREIQTEDDAQRLFLGKGGDSSPGDSPGPRRSQGSGGPG